MPPSCTGRHRWTGLFHPQREADHYAKTTGRNPEDILMSSVDRAAHIDGQLINLLWVKSTRFQRSINTSNKTSERCMNVCWVSVLTTFSAPPQILMHRQFSSPTPRNEEMMGDGFLWCYCCRFVLNSKRLLSTSCNKQASAVASSIFFMVLFWCFLKFAESKYVEN